MNDSLIPVLVLAAVAVFLILKLRSVLGTRDGFEPAARPAVEAARKNLTVVQGGIGEDVVGDHFPAGSDDANAVRRMLAYEPGFDLNEFLKGARAAYEMILMGFENGQLDKVKKFLAPDVHDSFAAVLKDRELRGLTVTATFVGLKELALADAQFDDTTREAELSVRFVGELNRIVKDRSGLVVDGNANDIIRQRDVWTFARKFGSNDPNWLLVATSD